MSRFAEPVISISDALVYEYLEQNGHKVIANDLRKARDRDQLPNLHGITLKTVTKLSIPKVNLNEHSSKGDKCTNNFVLKYLLVNGHVDVAREFKSCTQSRLKDDDHKEMHLEDLLDFYETFNYNDRSKWVPIQDIFQDKEELINELDNGQSEVAKVLRCILETNIPIRVEQIKPSKRTFSKSFNSYNLPSKALPGINTRRFSVARFGESSEEYQINQAKHELLDMAMVHNEKKLYKDLINIDKTHQWALCIVGCYLSKYLRTARYPQKVFVQVAKPVVFNTGVFSEEDIEVISKHVASCDGVVDYNMIGKKLNRAKSDLLNFVRKLIEKSDKTRKGAFTLQEDTLILRFVLTLKVPQSLEDFTEILQTPINFESLASKLSRSADCISARWNAYLKSVILSLFHGTLGVDHRSFFFNYLIANKIVSTSQIDWVEVEKLFPSCTKKYLTDMMSGMISSSVKKIPLYQILSNRRATTRNTKTVERKVEVASVFDELRGIKPMRESTQKVLEEYNLQSLT